MDCRGYWLSSQRKDSPSCFNGYVSVYKWKISIEKVEEPIEVIQERLETLYRQSDNHHDYQPLQNFVKSIGYTFTGKFGQDK